MKRFWLSILIFVVSLSILLVGCSEGQKYARVEKKVRECFSENTEQLLSVAENFIHFILENNIPSAKHTQTDLCAFYEDGSYGVITDQHPALSRQILDLLDTASIIDYISVTESDRLFEGPTCTFSVNVYYNREMICTIELIYSRSGIATPQNEYIAALLEQIDTNWYIYREWRE